jgi:hypothetical protein
MRSGTMIRVVGPGGSNPLAPTTYERSDLLGQSRCQSVTDDVRGQVCRRLPEPEHVDVFEQGVGDHAAPGTALSRRPCLGLLAQVANRRVGRYPPLREVAAPVARARASS